MVGYLKETVILSKCMHRVCRKCLQAWLDQGHVNCVSRARIGRVKCIERMPQLTRLFPPGMQTDAVSQMRPRLCHQRVLEGTLATPHSCVLLETCEADLEPERPRVAVQDSSYDALVHVISQSKGSAHLSLHTDLMFHAIKGVPLAPAEGGPRLEREAPVSGSRPDSRVPQALDSAGVNPGSMRELERLPGARRDSLRISETDKGVKDVGRQLLLNGLSGMSQEGALAARERIQAALARFELAVPGTSRLARAQKPPEESTATGAAVQPDDDSPRALSVPISRAIGPPISSAEQAALPRKLSLKHLPAKRPRFSQEELEGSDEAFAAASPPRKTPAEALRLRAAALEEAALRRAGDHRAGDASGRDDPGAESGLDLLLRAASHEKPPGARHPSLAQDCRAERTGLRARARGEAPAQGGSASATSGLERRALVVLVGARLGGEHCYALAPWTLPVPHRALHCGLYVTLEDIRSALQAEAGARVGVKPLGPWTEGSAKKLGPSSSMLEVLRALAPGQEVLRLACWTEGSLGSGRSF